ncbi:uncharacterized protein LOC129577636 [Sitodiplosis mosellana]|uniref:uncharacterized protein LOC129577636 n=1 Tax=Sitodiplosis mosellana TaxID=263140 RepID=UPI0024441A02|nr:uncharacterized protein LOC129577636 [Sitodiplosis mosellana]
MPLDKDNAGHRDFSNRLDAKFTGNSFYDKAARPIIHGAYHAGRYVRSSNPEEMARAKDQFSKFGTGQSQTEYLAVYREQQKQQEQSFPKSVQEQLTPQSFQEQLTPKSWNEKLFPDLMQQQQQQQQQPKSMFDLLRKN